MRVRDITDNIKWTDQIYGAGQADAPVLTFPRPKGRVVSYTKTAVSKIAWASDYVAQYIPVSTPYANEAPHLVGRICSLVSIYPVEGRTVDYCRTEAWSRYELNRWPDAIMLREVYHLVAPPLLRNIVDDAEYRRLTSGARGRLGEPTLEPTSALFEGLANCGIRPELNLYRSPAALAYLAQIEANPTLQVVANRRTGKAGYVYALALQEYPGLLKIGSAFDPSVRIAGLSTAVPTDFRCVAAEFFDDCRGAELEIHNRLAEQRVRPNREWFRATEEEFAGAAHIVRINGAIIRAA
jgi:hypothetical protein